VNKFNTLGDELKYMKTEVVYYGIKGQAMTGYTFTELLGCFKSYNNFRNPATEKITFFSTESMKGLLFLAQMTQRGDLYSVINNILQITLSNHQKGRSLFNFYQNTDNKTKEIIQVILRSILDLGFYMRGWDGKNQELPIVRAPILDYNKTEAMVNTGIVLLDDYQQKYEISKMILTLPLMKYSNDQYIASNTVGDGFTIMDRINIVKQGDTGDNMSSCIRLSSNWIVTSAYFYLSLLGMTPNFEIKNLRNIS